MHNKKHGTAAIALIGALLFTSCASTPVSKLESTVPIGENTKYENLGWSGGSSSTWSFLGLWMRGRPDVDRAFAEAIRKKNGDAMVGVTCRERTLWFILFSITTVSVQGEVIKFIPTEKKDARKN
ncbi:MAG TPA: hypothetical protein VLM75_12515 [Spirochaetota bacterium]|nr:hypothetical protein [Spirochaetota bacterium]